MQPKEAGVTSHTPATGPNAKTGHTPTPWHHSAIIETGIGMRPKQEWPIYTDSGRYGHPATANNEADADFIVRACNAHDALLEACHDAREFIDGQIDVVDGDDGVPAPNKAMKLATLLDEAIKKAVSRA